MAVTSLIALTATFVLGLLLSLGHIQFRHFLLAIPVTALVTFTHAMTMFFLIGIGSRVKEVLKETGIEGDYRQEIRSLHNTLFPPATLAILATILAFVLGGGADTRVLPPIVHGAAALLAVVLNFWTVYVEFQTVIGCVALVDKLGREIEAVEDGGPLPGATGAR
jgi:hypothetical protein